VLAGLKESEDPYFVKLKQKLKQLNPDSEVGDDFNGFIHQGA